MEKESKIGEMMVRLGLIDELQLQSALGHQKRWGGKLGKALVDLGFIEEETMLKFLAEQFKMKAVNLVRSRITPQTFAAVPENLARKYEVVPVVCREVGGKKTIILAMSDPSDLRAIDEIQFFTNAKVEPVLATSSAIAKVLKHYGNYSPEMEQDSVAKDVVTPAQLRREATRRATAPKPRPVPPPRPPAPSPPPASAQEDDFDFETDEDLEVVKGEVTLIKATKAPDKKAPPPTRPTPPPESPFLVKPEEKPAPARGRESREEKASPPPPPPQPPPSARVAPPPPPPAPVIAEPSAPSKLEAPPLEFTPLPEEEEEPLLLRPPQSPVSPPSAQIKDEEVLLGASQEEEEIKPSKPLLVEEKSLIPEIPPALDDLMEPLKPEASELAPPPPGPKPLEAIDLGEEEGSQELELASAYEFIPPAPSEEPAPTIEQEWASSKPADVPEELLWEEEAPAPPTSAAQDLDQLLERTSAPPPSQIQEGVEPRELSAGGEEEVVSLPEQFLSPLETPLAEEPSQERESQLEIENGGSPLPEPPSLSAPPLDFLEAEEKKERPAPPLPEIPAAPSAQPPPSPPLAGEDLWAISAEEKPTAEEDIWEETPAELETFAATTSPPAPASEPAPSLPDLPDLPPLPGEEEIQPGGPPGTPALQFLEEEAQKDEDFWGAEAGTLKAETRAAPAAEKQQVAFLSFEAPPPETAETVAGSESAPAVSPSPPTSPPSTEPLEELFRQASFSAPERKEPLAEAEPPLLEPPPFFEDFVPPAAPTTSPPSAPSLAETQEPPDLGDLVWMEEADTTPLPEKTPSLPAETAKPAVAPSAPELAEELAVLGEMKMVSVAPDESPEFDETSAEIARLENLGEEFLDTREVKARLSRITELEQELKNKEFQFNELLNLMMKKEMGEITQELFMKELQVLKKKMSEKK